LELSFVKMNFGNKFISISLFPFILLIYLYKIYGNFITAQTTKEDVTQTKDSYFKEKFKNLSKEEILIKPSEKQHLTQEAITLLEELLDKKQ